eukprot:5219016-Alexandrium_andersonii.AAC.1
MPPVATARGLAPGGPLGEGALLEDLALRQLIRARRVILAELPSPLGQVPVARPNVLVARAADL